MAQILLDESKVDARFEEMRGVAVAERMDVRTLVDAALLHGAHKGALETGARDMPYGRVMERRHVAPRSVGKSQSGLRVVRQ